MGEHSDDKGKRRVIRQSAAIPFRRRGGRLEVLLITSMSRGAWIVPKGLVESDLSDADSAAKEAEEEAGVRGRVGHKAVGSYEYQKWGGTCVVRVFDLEVEAELDDWPERRDRRRRWTRVDEAAEAVENKRLRKMIQQLPDRVADRPPRGRDEG